MIHEIVFSCAGTTRLIADKISKELDNNVAVCDILSKDFDGIDITGSDDIVILAVPVWGGRVPALAAKRLRKIKGDGQRAVAVVVYGNRDYDDALIELCDIAAEQGFMVKAAAAFVAEHCIFPTVAAERPDIADGVALTRFVHEAKVHLASCDALDLSKVKGNRPYKKAAGVPLHPETDKNGCKQCGACAGQCPTGAIDADSLTTDPDKCISCCRCIAVCNNDARTFGGIMYKTIRFVFEKLCAKRREPEWFV